MKKTSIRMIYIVAIITMIFSFNSCGKNNEELDSSKRYYSVSIDQPYYQNLKELANEATGIFTGKVIGKEVINVNNKNGNCLSDIEDVRNGENKDDYSLYTVYEVQLDEVYFGEFNDKKTIKIKVLGDNETVIVDNAPVFNDQDNYLFFIREYTSLTPVTKNPIMKITTQSNSGNAWTLKKSFKNGT